MATDVAVQKAERQYPLGVSRPPLAVEDLPTPEEVFGVRRLGFKEMCKFALGPSLIALGIAVGSGEWLLGPLAIGPAGFIGLGFVILLSALLQAFYNIEIGRYVVATGEVPVLGFARTPPGYLFWAPFALFVLYFANMLGGWAAAAGQGLVTIFTGEIASGPSESWITWAATVVLLFAVLLIAAASRKISRALQIVALFLIGFELIALLIIDLFIVPASVWGEAFRGFLTPALPPDGTNATVLGGLVGFTALASGLNWYIMSHYRDQGYGMGYRVGFIPGGRGESKDVLPVGATFPDDEKNAALWRRWLRLLKIDMWAIFFVGAILGMLLPTVLMRHLVLLSGREPTEENIPTFAAEILGSQYGSFLFYLALILGFLILFDTQVAIFEALVRNFVDTVNGVSARFRAFTAGDPRRFYFPYMIFLTIVIAGIIRLAAPAQLILITANMSNFGALFFPFVLMYLNSKLPRPAKPPAYVYVLLLLNTLFFGFFFINFVWDTFVGGPLIKF
ncbi:MAG TPA: Nramp family divalent metal transporter [Actinomycetota bacterium]|nr:Nramp family divalent metal transporter [Actinomycetota bacterium]